MKAKGIFILLLFSLAWVAEPLAASKKRTKKPEPVDTISTKDATLVEEKKEEPTLKKEIAAKLIRYRDHHYTLFTVGWNTVETFGRTPYIELGYQYFIKGGSWFAEATGGAGGYKARIKTKPIIDGELYNNDLLFHGEILLSKVFSENRLLAPDPTRAHLPHVQVGVTWVYQGGVFSLGPVLGIGGILRPKSYKKFAWTYGMKNRIYWPDKVYSERFMTLNYHLYLGLQYLIEK